MGIGGQRTYAVTVLIPITLKELYIVIELIFLMLYGNIPTPWRLKDFVRNV